MTLALLLTAVTGAWADIAQDDVFMFGSYIDFGNGVWCKTFSGGTSNDAVVKSTKLSLTYGGYENGKHKLVFNSANATSYLYIYDANSAKPWGIKVTGGEGTSGNPFTFSTVYDWPNNCPQELIIGTDGTCSFDMPTSDVTVNYELVRDMSVQMPVTVQDAEQNSRFRVKKQGDTFVPADMNMEQIVALFTVHDDIENKDLTANTDFTVQLFAVNEEGQKPGEAIPFNNFTFAPGNDVATAVAASNSNYSGETALSNVFTLFQGYELEIAAGEYATYYKDEALYVEDEDAKLYTITTVGNETATATELTVAAANTPLLVKNNAAEAKTILLIPTITATPDDVTPYEGFKGTLEATQIAASTATQNNYALNGKEFVWVMDAIDIAANRAWLEIPATTTNSRALTIVFDDVTGLTTANIAKAMNGDWYDLNGRKLQAAPTKKGVYILNGKKVVVK